MKARKINEEFFNNWSPEMAWVLGIIYTDGHFGAPSANGDCRRIYIAQKDMEVLEKVKSLIESEHKILRNTQSDRKNVIYYFTFTNKKIYKSLIKLGLLAQKSLVLKFPNIPTEHIRHFIRGCWDGDGSFYYEKDNPLKIRGDYVSGSNEFLQSLVNYLMTLGGISNIGIYTRKTGKNPSYSIKLSPQKTIKLFNYFYDNVNENCYYSKKYKILKNSYNLLSQVKKGGQDCIAYKY